MFTIYKDFSSIAFIRCIARIEGSPFYAEGTGFSINTAREKCRSELIERNFQVRNNIKALGIAAHRSPASSEANAYAEALETLMLQKIASERIMQGIPLINSGDLKISCSKINGLWFSLLIGKKDNSLVYTYSTRATLIGSVLQSWSEYRNIKFYNVGATYLSNYTKGNKLFQNFAPRIIFSLRNETLDTSNLKKFTKQEGSHIITYYTKGEEV